MIGTPMALDSAAEKKLYQTVTDGLHLPTDRDCRDQTGHNDFEVQEGRNPGFSVLNFGSETICLIVFSALHIYEHYLIAAKKNIADVLRREDVANPGFSIFVEHGYMQHGKYDHRVFHSLGYYIDLLPSSYHLSGMEPFAYGVSFAGIKKSATGSGKQEREKV